MLSSTSSTSFRPTSLLTLSIGENGYSVEHSTNKGSIATPSMSHIQIGTALPLLFQRLRIDPAHAGATIQVAMDGIGVTLTCVVSCLVLGLPLSGHLETEHVARQPPANLINAIQREGTKRGLHMFGSSTMDDGGN